MRRIRARLSRAALGAATERGGVDVYFGEARFAGPDTIVVAGKTLRFRKALIATGARPQAPPIPGLAEAGYLTNENVFDLTECPRRLLVIGGGPLGCELAQAFCRLGIAGHHRARRPDVPAQGGARRRADSFRCSCARRRRDSSQHQGGRRSRGRQQKIVDLVSDDDKISVAVDEILVGIGRVPNVEGMNLEAAGVKLRHREPESVSTISCRTSNPRIYAAGDVCLEHKFTHIAEASARIVVRNALFLGRKRLSELTIPWCTYTDPEIAHIGLYVREAREKAIPVKTFTVLMHDVDRAITDGEEEGFVKIHVRQGTDRILGATVVASHAGEMINEISLAIGSGIGLRALAQVNHPYPTQANAIKMAADAYNCTRLTPTLKFLSRCWLAW